MSEDKLLEKKIENIKKNMDEGKVVLLGGKAVKDVEVIKSMRSKIVKVIYDDDDIRMLYTSEFLRLKVRYE